MELRRLGRAARPGRARSRTEQLAGNGLPELVRAELDLSEDLADKGAGDVTPPVMWNGGGPTIGVTVEDMATALAHDLKPQSAQHPFEFPGADYGELAHTCSSTCCRPTKRGRSASSPS